MLGNRARSERLALHDFKATKKLQKAEALNGQMSLGLPPDRFNERGKN